MRMIFASRSTATARRATSRGSTAISCPSTIWIAGHATSGPMIVEAPGTHAIIAITSKVSPNERRPSCAISHAIDTRAPSARSSISVSWIEVGM